jgi:hypothetical protein
VQQYLTIWDLVLTPVYLAFIVLFATRHRDKRYPVGHPLRAYYLPGLYAKLGGAIFIGLIYQYYYGGGGDTFNYFVHAKIINSSLNDSVGTWFELMRQVSPDRNPRLFQYSSQMEWYGSAATYTVAAITAFLGLLNGTSYIPIALLFAWISFSGIWAMYRTFTRIYPGLEKQLAIAFLFIPSVVVWGSSIFKDTVCMFGLGWMVYCTFRLFVNRDLSFKNIVLLSAGFYLVAVIKVYILLAFLPALSLWLLMTYSHRLRSAGMRWIVNILFLGIVAAGFIYFADQFAKELNKYSLEKIAQTAQTTRGWISYSSGDEGSAYSLGDFSPTIGGMLSKFPAAVVVTLYRPFIWEAKKPIILLSALEALVFLIFTLRVIATHKFKTLSIIGKDPTLTFCLVFSIIFAFAVGISSYNFGALSRYKIPCLPFYSALLVILYYYPLTSSKKTTVTARKKSFRNKIFQYS